MTAVTITTLLHQGAFSSVFAGSLVAAARSLFLPEPFQWLWLVEGAERCKALARIAAPPYVAGSPAAGFSGEGLCELRLQISDLQQLGSTPLK